MPCPRAARLRRQTLCTPPSGGRRGGDRLHYGGSSRRALRARTRCAVQAMAPRDCVLVPGFPDHFTVTPRPAVRPVEASKPAVPRGHAADGTIGSSGTRLRQTLPDACRKTLCGAWTSTRSRGGLPGLSCRHRRRSLGLRVEAHRVYPALLARARGAGDFVVLVRLTERARLIGPAAGRDAIDGLARQHRGGRRRRGGADRGASRSGGSGGRSRRLHARAVAPDHPLGRSNNASSRSISRTARRRRSPRCSTKTALAGGPRPHVVDRRRH